ncbi:MAG: DUF1549 domain-containing protein [Planctomycetia bacterium]
MNVLRRCIMAWLGCGAAACFSSARAVDFAHEVVPLIKKHCGECHAGDARQGGFSMNTREDLLTGGDSGTPGIVAGHAADSEIIARITSDDPDYRMPSEGDPLPPEAIAVLKRWIDDEAPWEPGFAFKRTTWEPPLALRRVDLPPPQDGRTNPVDRIVDAYWHDKGVARPPRADDRTFIRRASLDLVGLLPDPDRVARFVADQTPEKRTALVRELLADRVAYAEHWMTFWNDLLRNDYTGTGFITGGRRQITRWLHTSLVQNKPFDQFVRGLIAPTEDARGFIDGIVWRGTVNASQTVPIQFAQNVGQTFLGINLKCASCHDSFVDRWTLRQTYDLAAIVSAQPLELHRCDKATGTMATPAWLFADLGQVDPEAPPARRLDQLAALMTRPENGWLSRTLVNRLWHRLIGRGVVHPVDSLRLPPWSEDLLDMLAADLVDSQWDVKHVLETICTSEAYAAATPAATAQPQGGDYVFRGPLPRRMTAEQFTDAVWQLTNTAPPRPDAEVLRFEPPADADVEPAAKWIWSNDLASSPPGEKLTFRTTFNLPSAAAHAVVVFAADNEAAVVVNGKPAAKGTDWTKPVMEIVTNDLRKGANEIVVTAANGAAGGPAALTFDLRVKTVDGATHTIASDQSWQWTSATPDAKGAFPKGQEPTDWAPAAVVTTQNTWSAAMADFAAKLVYAIGPDTLPMVRAVLVKGTALMAALGRPNRDQVVTSRPSDLTTLEAIQLANEQSLADEFARGGVAILRSHGPSTAAILEWMFAAALGREPTPAEAAAARELLGETPTAEGIADCLWAIVMLPEFQLIR